MWYVIAIIVSFAVAMLIGRCINGMRTEWFARIGVVIIGCVTIPVYPDALSIAFMIGFTVQTTLRIKYIIDQRRAKKFVIIAQ